MMSAVRYYDNVDVILEKVYIYFHLEAIYIYGNIALIYLHVINDYLLTIHDKNNYFPYNFIPRHYRHLITTYIYIVHFTFYGTMRWWMKAQWTFATSSTIISPSCARFIVNKVDMRVTLYASDIYLYVSFLNIRRCPKIDVIFTGI